MSQVILLAADRSENLGAAVQMTKRIASGSSAIVIVLHVHGIASGRFGKIRTDCTGDEGEELVTGIAKELEASGVTAKIDIREADFKILPKAILQAAGEYDADLLVLGSSDITAVPSIPRGGVSRELLNLATRPVLVAPKKNQ